MEEIATVITVKLEASGPSVRLVPLGSTMPDPLPKSSWYQNVSASFRPQ
jgi:hypothetical protein